MTASRIDLVARRLGDWPENDATDRELLAAFRDQGDETAFTLLLRRHGQMVLRVCSRLLPQAQDAEDAFQATFLVLVRHPATVRKSEAVASWLHGIARRVALKARRAAARRKVHESQRPPMTPPTADDLSWREVQTVLDEELQKLPARFRAPFVLCVLEGRSRAEAAKELGCNPGTLNSRLAEARKRLQTRLARRGITLSALLAAEALIGSADATVPAALSKAVIQTVLIGGSVAPAVLALANDVGRSLLLAKVRNVAESLLVAGLIAVGVVLATWQPPAEAKPPQLAQLPAPRQDKPAESERVLLVRGQVVNPDQKPVAGAKVFATREPDKLAKEPLAVTDKEGRFTVTIPALPANEDVTLGSQVPVVAATAEGFAGVWRWLDGSVDPADLTLRLVADDVPLTGRILEADGKPVAGASLTISRIDDLEAYLQGLKEANRSPRNRGWTGPLPGMPSSVKTDEAGKYRLPGVGRERVVFLQVVGPGLQQERLWTMTHGGQTISTSRLTIVPTGSDFTAKAGRVVRGVVRDRSTNKPLSGVHVREGRTGAESTTDAEGRYELNGCPKTNVLGIFATPPGDSLCFPGSVSVNDPGGLGPITGDLALARGLALHGKALDGDGKPVPGTVSYYALHPNPLAQAQTEGYGPVTVKVKADGSFTCPVLPGPGAVLFSTPRRDFAAAHVDARAFFQGVNDEARVNNGEHQLLGELGAGRGGPRILYQESYQSIVLLHPTKDEKLQPMTLSLEKAKTVTLKMLDPDGQPVAGTRVRGLRENGDFDFSLPQPAAEVAVDNLSPRRSRMLAIRQEGKKLVGLVLITPDQGPTLDVRLQPWASVRGKLVTAEGKPQPEMNVTPRPVKGPNGEELVNGFVLQSALTDGEGNFVCDGLLPGWTYKIGAWRPVGRSDRQELLETELVLKAGEVKDLGTVKSSLADK